MRFERFFFSYARNSGIHASSLSGWLFGAAVVAGILLGLPIRRRLLARGSVTQAGD